MLRSFANIPVLIIDDTELGRELVAEILQRNGLNNIHFAKNGVEGLKKTEEIRPGLVIVDLFMPEMDGFEYCRHVSANPEYQSISLIAQTVSSDSQKKTEAFMSGASDVLTKPISADELAARTKVLLEKQLLLNELSDYRKRMDSELVNAKQMQISIMPNSKQISATCKNYNLDIASYFAASEMLSGDLWGFKALSPSTLAIFQVDFCGHGILAALNSFRLHTLMQNKIPPGLNPAMYLQRLNNELCTMLRTGEFATMFCGIIDTANNQLTYAAAATTSPILLSPGEKQRITLLDGSGLPLGIQENSEYTNISIPFNKGNTLFCYSDALIEKAVGSGDSFDERELIKCCNHFLDTKINHTAQNLLDHVMDDFYKTTGDCTLHDDLTLSIFKRLK